MSPQPGGRSLCDPIWHVSSGSGVATLRTAVHLLLYIFTFLPLPVSSFIYSYFITYSASCNQVVVCQPLLKSHLIWSVTGSTRCRPVRFVHCGYFQFSFRTGVHFTSVNVRWTSPEQVKQATAAGPAALHHVLMRSWNAGSIIDGLLRRLRRKCEWWLLLWTADTACCHVRRRLRHSGRVERRRCTSHVATDTITHMFVLANSSSPSSSCSWRGPSRRCTTVSMVDLQLDGWNRFVAGAANSGTV